METYQERIQPEATQATAPEELHPVAAAFGGDIGAALEKGGEEVANRIQSLSVHMARMNYYRNEAAKQDLLNQYQTELQDKTIGPPNDQRTVTMVGGKVMPPEGQLTLGASPDTAPNALISGDQALATEVPYAIYNRTGYAANGALDDLNDWHHATAQKYLEQAKMLGVRVDSQFKSSMDKLWTSEQASVAKHVVQQVEQAQVKTYMTGLQLDADNAVTKQDPASLGLTIGSINDKVNGLISSQHLQPDSQEAQNISEFQKNKFIGQALNNSMTANLKSTGGDPAQFQSILDKLHDDGRINDTVYENSSQKLDKVARGMRTQDEMAAKTQMVNQRMNTMQLALQNKLDLNNPNTASEISANDPELGTALSNYNLNSNTNYKDADEAFAKATDNVFSAGSKEQISKYMMNVLKEGKISQDRLNILFGAAMDRGKSLADLEGQSKSSNPIQNLIDQGMKVLFGTNANEKHPDAQTLIDYMKSVKEGKTVPEAIQQAQGQNAVRDNPHLLNIPPNGQIFHDKYGNRRIVYPDLHTEAIGGKKSNKSGNEESNANSND